MPHCVSSRYVLSHYSKCKDHVCPVCGPVREAIRRNFERSKEVVKLSSSSMNAPRPSDGQNNMQGFTYPGSSTGGDYALEFGTGFGNGFGVNNTNPVPQLENNVTNPVAVNQKLLSKKTKKEKPEKNDKKDGSEGPPAKKIRTSTSAKALALAAVAVNTNTNNNHTTQPDNIQINNFNGDENMKNFQQYNMTQNQIQNQHSQNIPPNVQNNMLVVAPPKVLSIFPLDPVSCALYNFSGENVNLHFKHIHEGMKITTCR